MRYLFYSSLLFLSYTLIAQNQYFQPGKDWLDTEGKLIEAHATGILKQGDTYFWYGENKSKGNLNKVGISCYSSKDLLNWKNEGVVLTAANMPNDFNAAFTKDAVCERAKVIYNAKTKKYVMWMHLDSKGYTLASAGIAIADKPNGNFKFINFKRPVKYAYNYNLSRGEAYSTHEKELGNTFRDMNLFVDTDGKAYVFYASEDNATMYVVRLNDSFTDVEQPLVEGKNWARIFVNGNREAPAPFKYNNKYYIFTSGLTGWAPNPAQYAVATSIFGPWEVKGNPCVGKESETTFRSQSTFVLPAPNAPVGSFIFMADRWDGTTLENSRYMWLPFVVKDEEIVIRNYEKWNLSIFNNKSEALSKPNASITSSINGMPKLTWTPVAGADIYQIYKNGKNVGATTYSEFAISAELAARAYHYTVVAQNIQGNQSPPSLPIIYQTGKAKTINLNEIEPDFHKQGWGNLKYNKNIDDGNISIAGKPFASGIGTHAPAQTVYYLGGSFNSFSGFVGRTTGIVDGEVQFFIYGDGKLLWKSPLMKANTAALPFAIDITNIQELNLVATEGTDGTSYDHVAWCDAILGVK